MTPAKVYTEMKDSGADWIGKIPATWDISKIGTLYTQRNERVSDRDYPPLSVTMKGILPQLATAAKTDDGDNRKLVRVGDFAINSRSDRRGSCGISPYDGSVSLINTILIPRKKMHPRYYDWLFHTTLFADEFYKWGHGIVDDLWTTRWQEMKRILVPVPPYETQSTIAAYLDTQCAKIDEIIAQAKASIEDYKQWKASVVDECISQALTSSPQVRLKFLMTYIVDCPHETPEYCLDGDYLVIRTADQDYGFLRPDDSMYRLNEAEFHKRSRRLPLEKNDIVYGREGERWGLACLVPESGKYCLGQRIMQFRCKVDRILPHYAMWALNSRHVYLQGIVDTLGSTSPHVNISTIRNYYIPIPPIPEQRRISTYLFERCGAIDAIIKSKQSLIDDLESYKKSLIYEVVTGKRRVC